MLRRSGKDEFLVALESWMNEIVAKNADGHNEAIPRLISDGFHDSIKASEKYHTDLAKAMEDDAEQTLARYHFLMADSYKKLICR